MINLKSIPKQTVLSLLKLYRLAISPFLGANCRFYPTCSQYSIEAVERYGAFKGGLLSLKRVSKCHPLHSGGVDMVP